MKTKDSAVDLLAYIYHKSVVHVQV